MSQVLLCILTTLTSESAEEARKQPDVRSTTYTFCFTLRLILAGESFADF